MKIIKTIVLILTVLCLACGAVACGESDELVDFEPTGVVVVENLNSNQYETKIDDEKTVKKLWDKINEIEIDETKEGKIGSAYVYMCFYGEDENTIAVFTIYDNGSCCLGEDFKNIYALQNGRDAYLDFCDIYSNGKKK